MILGIGIDLLKISRISNLASNLDDPFFTRTFTEEEIKQSLTRTDPSVFLATRFAGKEAVFKAISKCGCDFRPSEIEIIDLENGQPQVKLHGTTDSCVNHWVEGKFTLHISISYETEFAEAMAIMEAELP